MDTITKVRGIVASVMKTDDLTDIQPLIEVGMSDHDLGRILYRIENACNVCFPTRVYRLFNKWKVSVKMLARDVERLK